MTLVVPRRLPRSVVGFSPARPFIFENARALHLNPAPTEQQKAPPKSSEALYSNQSTGCPWSLAFGDQGTTNFVRAKSEPPPTAGASIVVFQPQMRNQIRAHDVPQRILQLHRLNKQIVLRIEPRRRLRRLQIKAQPLLNPARPQLRRTLRQ